MYTWVYVCVCVYSVVSDYFATPWITAHQALLSIGFSRQEYCSGLSFPSPGDLPNPGIEPAPLATSPALAGRFFTTKPHNQSSVTMKLTSRPLLH